VRVVARAAVEVMEVVEWDESVYGALQTRCFSSSCTKLAEFDDQLGDQPQARNNLLRR